MGVLLLLYMNISFTLRSTEVYRAENTQFEHELLQIISCKYSQILLWLVF